MKKKNLVNIKNEQISKYNQMKNLGNIILNFPVYKYILVGLLLTILIYLFNQYKHKKKNNSCILFTMYNEPSRRKLYTDVIKWWKRNTDLDIYIVNSYGDNSLDNLDVNIVSFDQSEIAPSHFSTSTDYEIFSIQYAIDNIKELSNYDYVFKITGKYRLPGATDILSNISPGYQIILQNNPETDKEMIKNNHNNTEIMAFNGKNIKKIINILENEESILEQRIVKYIKKNKIK